MAFVGGLGGQSGRATAAAVGADAVCLRRAAARARSAKVVRVCAAKDAEKEEAVEETVPLVKPSEEEEAIRDQVIAALEFERKKAADAGIISRRKLGATRDVDGKSNVWAVEPMLSMDDNTGKPNYALVAIGVAVLAVIIAGILPQLTFFNNPDQF